MNRKAFLDLFAQIAAEAFNAAPPGQLAGLLVVVFTDEGPKITSSVALGIDNVLLGEPLATMLEEIAANHRKKESSHERN